MPMKIGLFIASNSIRYGSYGILLGGLGLLGLVLGKASLRKTKEKELEKKVVEDEQNYDNYRYESANFDKY